MPAKTLFLASGHTPTTGANWNHLIEGAIVADFVDTMKAHAEVMIPDRVLNLRDIGRKDGVYFVPRSYDLQATVDFIKDIKARVADGDLAVEFHLNFTTKPQRGALAIVDQTIIGRAAAAQFLQDWCNHTGIPNRGVNDSKYFAKSARGFDNFQFCTSPAADIIMELGFINSTADMHMIRSVAGAMSAIDYIWNAWLRTRDNRA